MQYGPYDAYMEVPYKNVDEDTKSGFALQLGQFKEKIEETKRNPIRCNC